MKLISLHEPSESPQGFGVRWLAGNGADTALEFMARVQSQAACALAPHPPHSKTLARVDACATTSDAAWISNQRGWMTWIPHQLFYFRPAPPGVWTVCYHHNDWTASRLQRFRGEVDDYRADIASLEEVLEKNAPRERKWSAWLCMQPRLSRFLMRVELKLWAMTWAKVRPSTTSGHRQTSMNPTSLMR